MSHVKALMPKNVSFDLYLTCWSTGFFFEQKVKSLKNKKAIKLIGLGKKHKYLGKFLFN